MEADTVVSRSLHHNLQLKAQQLLALFKPLKIPKQQQICRLLLKLILQISQQPFLLLKSAIRSLLVLLAQNTTIAVTDTTLNRTQPAPVKVSTMVHVAAIIASLRLQPSQLVNQLLFGLLIPVPLKLQLISPPHKSNIQPKAVMAHRLHSLTEPTQQTEISLVMAQTQLNSNIQLRPRKKLVAQMVIALKELAHLEPTLPTLVLQWAGATLPTKEQTHPNTRHHLLKLPANLTQLMFHPVPKPTLFDRLLAIPEKTQKPNGTLDAHA